MQWDPRDVKQTEARRALGVVRSSRYRTPSRSKVLDGFARNPGEAGVRGGALVDDVEELEALW